MAKKNNLMDKLVFKILFYARKCVYEEQLQPLTSSSINIQPIYWYKKTIDPQNS